MDTLSRTYDNWAGLLEVWNEQYNTNETTLYQELARASNGPTVELGIGYGRIAQVVKPSYGVDISSTMLTKCRERLRNNEPKLIHSSMEDYDLPELATFTYLPQNTISNINPGNRRKAFLNVLKNTQAGGHFAFDAAVPDIDIIRQRSNVPMFCGRSATSVVHMVEVLKSTKPLECETHVVLETLDRLGNVVGKRYYLPMAFYYISPAEVEELSKSTGWTVEGVWGGFSKEKFESESKTQVWLLRKL